MALNLKTTSMARMTLVALVVAACGAGAAESGQGSFGASPAGSPSTTLSTSAAESCTNFVDVVETGPPPTDFSEGGPVGREQERLRADVEAASAYGAAHAAEFASIRIENAPRVRIVIGFTAHLEVHCAALRASLAFPDEFEIIRQPVSESRLEEIQKEIVSLAGQQMRAVGIGAGTIDVALRADGKSTADQLFASYGNLVSITVGMLPYPDPNAGGRACASLLGTVVTDTPLVATARLDVATVKSGKDFRGMVTVTNSGHEPIAFESGDPMTALILRAGSAEILGGFDGGVGGVGRGATLEPGGTIDIGVLGGTASCVPALGYALPPGRYDVRVPVDQYAYPGGGALQLSYLLSASVPLTIVP